MKIVLTYSELRALLAPVIPHASTDDMLPSICQIPVAESGGYLVAQATDRFTAAFQRVKPEQKVPKGFAIQLETRDARRLLSLFKPLRYSDPEITIETTPGGEIRVSGHAAGFALGFTGLNVEVASPAIIGKGGQFPDLASLIPADFDQPPIHEQGFSIELLSRFRAAVEHRDRTERGILVRAGSKPAAPMIVTTGDPDFVGLVMPRRLVSTISVVDTVALWRGKIPRNGVKAATGAPAKPLAAAGATS